MLWLNGKLVGIQPFPNGESRVNGEQIAETTDSSENLLTFKYERDGDLIQLMLVKKHLDRLGCTDTYLRLLYMPYSRMDRAEYETTVFTLKYVAEFINSLNFKEVNVVEPHSDVTCALLDRSYATYPTIGLIENVANLVGFDKERDYLFFPDAGAQKRYSKVTGYQSFVGYKHRDFQTGKITSLELVGQPPTTGYKAIIVDDLCSYGGTFLASANKLREAGASEVYLLIAHCELAIFKGELLKSNSPIDKVFTTNSILPPSGDEKKIFMFELI